MSLSSCAMSRPGLRVCFALLVTLFLSSCASSPKTEASRVVPGPQGQYFFDIKAVNSAEAMQQPYVVIVSIDGYRYDYNRLFSPPHLLGLEKEGVSAQGLIPPYPSKTFPSHYSMATGLRPGRHGIVSNEFYDPALDATYALYDRNAVESGVWYFGEPFWAAAGRHGMLSASFFWIGSEAPIGGVHPHYFYRYDSNISYDTRIDQVLAWLKLPVERRPHLITLYFDGVDTAGHRYGVRAAETRQAVMDVDKAIGRLREGLKETGLPVNLIVLSDHGMLDLDPKKAIVLDETPAAQKALAHFQAVGRGPQMHLYLLKGEPLSAIDEAQRVLRRSVKHARIYKRSQMESLGYASTPRSGDLIVDADAPYVVGLKAQMPGTSGANHGWNPVTSRQMMGIFYASGPQFKEKFKLPAVENIHVYPLILRLLNLQQRTPIDGRLEPMFPALRESAVSSAR